MPKVAVTDYTFDSLDIETELFHAQNFNPVARPLTGPAEHLAWQLLRTA